MDVNSVKRDAYSDPDGRAPTPSLPSSPSLLRSPGRRVPQDLVLMAGISQLFVLDYPQPLRGMPSASTLSEYIYSTRACVGELQNVPSQTGRHREFRIDNLHGSTFDDAASTTSYHSEYPGSTTAMKQYQENTDMPANCIPGDPSTDPLLLWLGRRPEALDSSSNPAADLTSSGNRQPTGGLFSNMLGAYTYNNGPSHGGLPISIEQTP
ncbi:hypothetical protein PM082_004964 [Marasmius tenuissimus]|nr:hypothetical protein PM082_004964 [Marasmius tenuissimus]